MQKGNEKSRDNRITQLLYMHIKTVILRALTFWYSSILFSAFLFISLSLDSGTWWKRKLTGAWRQDKKEDEPSSTYNLVFKSILLLFCNNFFSLPVPSISSSSCWGVLCVKNNNNNNIVGLWQWATHVKSVSSSLWRKKKILDLVVCQCYCFV